MEGRKEGGGGREGGRGGERGGEEEGRREKLIISIGSYGIFHTGDLLKEKETIRGFGLLNCNTENAGLKPVQEN